MDFISTTLVTLSQPTGFWESILNAFKNGTGSYIVAVILIALIVRVLFSLVDIVNKKVNMKNMDINNKMRPELEAIQKKYGNDPNVLRQKQNEIYKKYQFNMMGTCLPMLITLVLQFVVFLTLWNSLQSVANYNIAEQYENMKNVYVSVITLNEDVAGYENMKLELQDAIDNEKSYEFETEIDIENSILKITLKVDGQAGAPLQVEIRDDLKLDETYNILKKYVIVPEETEEPTEEEPAVEPNPDEVVEGESLVVIYAENSENTETGEENEGDVTEEVKYKDTGYNEIFKKLAEDVAEQYYLESQEGFLWIKNVYKADSPTSPLFSKKEIKNYLSNYYSKAETALQKDFDYEGEIFDYVVTAGIGQKKLGVNGYYILTILAVAISFLSMWLSNWLMRGKNKNNTSKQSKLMYFIMPIIFGVFTFMYTSLFAIYIIVGQLVMMALSPLVTYIVKKWSEHDSKKKKDKDVIEVDYRRKDI